MKNAKTSTAEVIEPKEATWTTLIDKSARFSVGILIKTDRVNNS